jgi:hypothetical protein
MYPTIAYNFCPGITRYNSKILQLNITLAKLG